MITAYPRAGGFRTSQAFQSMIKGTGDLPAAILLIVAIDDPDEALAAVRITSNAPAIPSSLRS